MIAICREVDRESGKVAVYPVEAEVTDRLLFQLSIRQRLNPELSYYVTTKAHYSGFSDVIMHNLKKKRITPEVLKLMGGVVPLQ